MVRPINTIIAGGSGSGKTTTLNAISSFIPQDEIVVTIEDTLELNLKFLDGWAPLEATPSIFQKKSPITMDMLVRNALRMRPSRIILGEVRGPEATSLLVAMDIGLHGSMGTLHANNARETITRMTQSPMNAPMIMIPLIDLIIVENIIRTKEGVGKYITQVAEVGNIIQDTVELGVIYDWDSQTNELARTQYPILLKEKIASYRAGISKRRRREIEQDLKNKKLLGISSTNALELGIDIGSLEATICSGFPGTISSFKQQIGRSGRGEDVSISTLIPMANPLDFFYIHNPKILFGPIKEEVLITQNNK